MNSEFNKTSKSYLSFKLNEKNKLKSHFAFFDAAVLLIGKLETEVQRLIKTFSCKCRSIEDFCSTAKNAYRNYYEL